MSTPASSGGPSPLRVGGLALIGVGVVAGLIGLATLLPGGDGSSTAAPGTTASPAPTGPPANAAPPAATPSGVAVPSFGAAPNNDLAAPGSPGGDGAAGGAGGSGGAGGTGSGGAGSGGAGSGGSGSGGSGSGGSGGTGTGAIGGGGGTGVVKAPVRVYNNSTITGLAAHAADDFRSDGWTVDAVSNYPSGVIPTSTVYYRPGTAEQASATSLGNAFGMRVEPRFNGLDEATPGLIVIVTNDYQKR